MTDSTTAGPGEATDTSGDSSDEAFAGRLRDVDHRVKNNLQLVASLILLQSRRAPDESARIALKAALERVAAVATVHRRLFQGDPNRFEVADFLRDLSGDLAAAAGRDDLEIALDLERLTLPAAAAAPLAVVANELLGNALKHAFPAGRSGRITITLAIQGNACLLTIVDDGVGLQGGPPGFGSMVLKLLCQQLRADLQVADAQPGVRAAVTIPMTPDTPQP